MFNTTALSNISFSWEHLEIHAFYSKLENILRLGQVVVRQAMMRYKGIWNYEWIDTNSI